MCSVQIPMSLVCVQNAGEIWNCVWFALNSTLIRTGHNCPSVTWPVIGFVFHRLLYPITGDGSLWLALPQPSSSSSLMVCSIENIRGSIEMILGMKDGYNCVLHVIYLKMLNDLQGWPTLCMNPTESPKTMMIRNTPTYPFSQGIKEKQIITHHT